MVDTSAHLIDDNGQRPLPDLPEVVELSTIELQQFPSPGTQRDLKAQTGRDYMAMVGPDADSADRTQTQIWTKLRKAFPGLRWEDCAEVSLQITDTDAAAALANPSRPASLAPWRDSADSGG